MSEKSDFTSKVPKLTFSTILDQQIEQLKIDLLTQRFAQSRQQLSVDPAVQIIIMSIQKEG